MEKVRAGQGFNPCPICGKYEGLRITSREGFYQDKGETGTCLVWMYCNNCNIELWSHKCKSGHYTNHVDFLASRWNKLANAEQTKENKE